MRSAAALAIVLAAAPVAARAAPSPWCAALAKGAGQTVACPYAPAPKPRRGRDLAAPFTTGECRGGGALWMPTGAMTAADPFVFLARSPAFTWHVLPGAYPITLRMEDDRVALALIRFGAARPVRWEQALLPGEHPGRDYGYPVDAAAGCYADVATFGRVLARDTPPTSKGDGWLLNTARALGLFDRGVANLCLDDTGDNLVVFSSGDGDGSYGVWWGLDEHDAIVAAVTDFGVIER